MQLRKLMKFKPGTRQLQTTIPKQRCWQKSTRCTTGMEDIPHSMDTGHLDPDLRGSELHLGEAEEARDHSTLDITLKGT